jgi:hypothetical protein
VLITSGATTRQITFNTANESPVTLSVSVTTGGSCTNSSSAQVSVATMPYTFRLFAGTSGGSGSYDGPRSYSRVWSPFSIAIDGNGNTYFADTLNTIRKISATGEISTFAGLTDAPCGIVDGTRSAVRM